MTAIRDTHDLVVDPPANVLTRFGRRTCSVCGAAEIVRPNGTTYGSAVERTCEEQQERNAEYQKRYG